MSFTTSDQIVATLKKAGIKRLYGVTGDSLNFLNDAVKRDGSMEWIHVRHEETGAFAAGAEAQLTGKIACCVGSSGPGHVHLINGLYDAHRSGASVLAIASTLPSFEMGSSYFQETNTSKLFDDCSCYNQIATTPKQLARMLPMAMQQAVSKKGVAVLGLPADLTRMHSEECPSSEELFYSDSEVIPASESLEALASVLNSHEKITIFCGIGAKNAHDEVRRLSDVLAAPVGYSFRGKMHCAYDMPHEVGMTGLLGLPSAYDSMEKAEVILLLGTDFPYTHFIPAHAKVIQIEEKSERLGRRSKLALGIHGSVKGTLRALLPHLEMKKNREFLEEQLALYKKVKGHLTTYVTDAGKKGALHPEALTAGIDALLTDDAVVTVDTGMTCVWAARYITPTGKRELLGSFNHGSMANALPQAIGAACAFPKRQVVALCGDGGLSMSTGDLATVVEYRLPIKIIVYDNHSLGMVKLEMQVAGLPDWKTNMINPDFAKLGEAYGIKSIRIDDPQTLKEQLAEAFAYDGPVLVHVLTDPHALAMPPKVEFSQVKGMMLGMARTMLGGDWKEPFEILEANVKHLGEVL